MWATIQSAITIGWPKTTREKKTQERLEIPVAFAFSSHIQNMAPSKKPTHVWNIFAVMSIMHFCFFFPKKNPVHTLLFEGCLIFSP